MLRVFFSFACLFGLVSSIANAASIGSVINPNVVSRISDNSLEAVWKSGQAAPGTGGSIINIGDRLVTVARFDQVNSPFNAANVNFGGGGWTDEFTLVSVIQVHDKVNLGPGNGFRFTFTPSAVADPLGLGWGANTMVGLYSDPANNFANNPASIAAGIAAASDGAKWWEFGMNGTGVSATFNAMNPGFQNALGESWFARADTDDIAAIGLLPPGVSGGFFSLGLNLITQNAGFALANVGFGLEVTGSGNILGGGALNPPTGGWQSYDNLDMSIIRDAAIPEPGSMVIFGIMAAGVGMTYRRRQS